MILLDRWRITQTFGRFKMVGWMHCWDVISVWK